MPRPIAALAVALLAIVFSIPAEAAVTTVAQWRLGEADPGAQGGQIGNATTTPSVGALPLDRFGAPFYTSAVPPITSTLALQFDGADDRYSAAGTPSDATDNFGIEAWVRSNGRTDVNAALAYNGNTGSSGWGLFRFGSQYGFLFGGVTITPGGPVSTQWTHIAAVRASGVTTFYYNGVATATFAGAPNVPSSGASASMMVGGNPLLATEGFDGSVDEVRIFTFAPGAFVVSDLNLQTRSNVPTLRDGGLVLLALVLAGVALVALRVRTA